MNTLSKIITDEVIIPSLGITNKVNGLSKKETVTTLQNRQWMRDLVEQRSFFKNNLDVLSLMENDMNEYCYYSDVTEKKNLKVLKI